MDHLAVAPGAFHYLVAAGAEALEVAVLPDGGEGGQQLEGAVVALEQHLGDAGGAAEVAVDLERGMGAEEVGINMYQLVVVQFVITLIFICMVARLVTIKDIMVALSPTS